MPFDPASSAFNAVTGLWDIVPEFEVKMNKIDILCRFTGKILYSCAKSTIREAILEAIANKINLSRADLSGANLSGANLSRAYLSGADLSGAKEIPLLVSAQTSIVPESGPFFGWKKCNNGVIVKVVIGANARRSNSTGRKCRAEYVKVLEVFGSEVGISQHDNKTEYRTGFVVKCDKWEENRWIECGGGIHFFLTRIEAENY